MQETDVWDRRDLERSGLGLAADQGRPLGPFRFVVMGPPGSGKRTQAGLLAERLGASLVSSEDTDRLAQACSAVQGSDRLSKQGGAVVEEVSPWISASAGFTLEGFPRTLEQAEVLVRLLRALRIELTAVLYYELPVEWAISRLANRWKCRDCGAIISQSHWPQRQASLCERCGGVLRRSGRDGQSQVKERFARYEQEAAPVAEFFAQAGLLVTIEAEGCPEEVFQRTEFKLLNVLPAMT